MLIEEPLVKLERDDFNTCVDNSVKTWAKIIKDKKKANPNVRYGKILKLPIGQPIEEMEELLGNSCCTLLFVSRKDLVFKNN